MSSKAATFLTIFALGWAGILALMDKQFLAPIVRQIKSLDYSSTDGGIISSAVKESETDDGTVYGAKVEYKYSVNGEQFTGKRLSYNAMSSSDDWASDFVNHHPAGKKVQVFYDPHHPQNSVLLRGIQGSDLFMLAFSTPFHVVLLFFAWMFLVFRRIRLPAGGVKLIKEPRRVRARLNDFSAVFIFFAVVALLAFLSIFAVGLFFGGFHPSLHTMTLAWCVIVGGAIIAGLVQLIRVLSGKYDLIIDELGSFIELPATQGRKERQRVPFSEIESVEMETIIKKGGEGEDVKKYAVILNRKGATSERLAQWYNESKTRGFISWLQKQLPLQLSTPVSLEHRND